MRNIYIQKESIKSNFYPLFKNFIFTSTKKSIIKYFLYFVKKYLNKIVPLPPKLKLIIKISLYWETNFAIIYIIFFLKLKLNQVLNLGSLRNFFIKLLISYNYDIMVYPKIVFTYVWIFRELKSSGVSTKNFILNLIIIKVTTPVTQYLLKKTSMLFSKKKQKVSKNECNTYKPLNKEKNKNTVKPLTQQTHSKLPLDISKSKLFTKKLKTPIDNANSNSNNESKKSPPQKDNFWSELRRDKRVSWVIYLLTLILCLFFINIELSGLTVNLHTDMAILDELVWHSDAIVSGSQRRLDQQTKLEGFYKWAVRDIRALAVYINSPENRNQP